MPIGVSPHIIRAKTHYLGIDLGGTVVKASIFDRNGVESGSRGKRTRLISASAGQAVGIALSLVPPADSVGLVVAVHLKEMWNRGESDTRAVAEAKTWIEEKIRVVDQAADPVNRSAIE